MNPPTLGLLGPPPKKPPLPSLHPHPPTHPSPCSSPVPPQEAPTKLLLSQHFNDANVEDVVLRSYWIGLIPQAVMYTGPIASPWPYHPSVECVDVNIAIPFRSFYWIGLILRVFAHHTATHSA